MTRHEFLAKPAKVLRLPSLPKAARVAGTFILAGAGVVSMGMAPSFSNSKDMGDGIANPNPIANERLYVDPGSNARRQADQWRTSRPDDAKAVEVIARQPQAIWIGEWSGDPRGAVSNYVRQTKSAKALPVFVAYNIPSRDCGSYSAGGVKDGNAYRKWIRGFAAGLTGEAVVVLEPDAVAGSNCLSESKKSERYDLLRDAVQVLKSAGATVYLDAGNPNWIPAKQMAERLNRSGINEANGFALNVSNYYTNAQNIAYGEQLSRNVGGKHFIIDTSRNGNGSSGAEWCNPKGRAIGVAPTAQTNHALVDAYLWIKRPGESDGTCAGGPKAGQWWGDYALGLAKSQPVALASAN